MFEGSTIPWRDNIFVHLADNYHTPEKAPWAESEMLEKVANRADAHRSTLLGNSAPELELPAEGGDTKSLYAIQSPYTLLYLYSPNCKTCKVATPKVFELWKQYKDNGLAAYAVSTDGLKDNWKAFIKKENLTWTNVIEMDPNETNLDGKYVPHELPNIYMLDSTKTIIGRRLSFEELAKSAVRSSTLIFSFTPLLKVSNPGKLTFTL